MKISLELPDELYTEAKAVAMRQRTTLKALFTRALERELRGHISQPVSSRRVIKDASGWPLLQKDPTNKTTVTEKLIREMCNTADI